MTGAAIRGFSGGRAEGQVKMWNDERGFGFITPAAGGEDVFVHRSALQEGVQLSQGMAVSYDPEWDDRKRKDRAANVSASSNASAGVAAGGASPAGGPAVQGAPAQAPMPVASSFNIVSAANKWDISRQPLSQDADSSVVRQRVTIRADAPKGAGPDVRKEEFQLVGDGSWDKRLYPEGPDREEVVVLRPGGTGSRAAGQRGKGHGRNWAVEGRPGSTFDVLYDRETHMVAVEQAFQES